MVELNDMLREAGETFTLKEAEIERLKQLTAQYEQQLEDQASNILSSIPNYFGDLSSNYQYKSITP
ncbi:hypothetical protein DPMN_129194 [Dreissena polymorpha]|uniref:Uncharacterized protein n=1 Tax=Dreissena polymorpha TaxID=45954 RepID=A0A9D4H5B2_DREPO|nr:hypothetical protein DPMN_129194 [Dreissena polymorpha]